MIYLLALPMTFLGALGAYFFKLGSERATNLTQLIKTPRLYLGGLFYVGGALFNVVLLRYLDYSILYPMTAITYIWTLLLSHKMLGEPITKGKFLGIAVICAGVFLLTR